MSKLAKDIRDCCGCPTAYPAALLTSEACLVAVPGTPSPDCSNTSCNGIRCSSTTCAQPSLVCAANSAQAAAGLKACAVAP